MVDRAADDDDDEYMGGRVCEGREGAARAIVNDDGLICVHIFYSHCLGCRLSNAFL